MNKTGCDARRRSRSDVKERRAPLWKSESYETNAFSRESAVAGYRQTEIKRQTIVPLLFAIVFLSFILATDESF